MFFVPLVLACFSWPYTPQDGSYSWVILGAVGAVMLVLDLLYRLFNREVAWWSLARGGHLFFVPICLMGALALWFYIQHSLSVGYWLPPASAPVPSMME